MSLNQFQFSLVTNHVDPTERLEFPEEGDPRKDPLYTHPGYAAVLTSPERTYEHLSTGRRMSRDQYKRETALYDRALDVHYYPNEM